MSNHVQAAAPVRSPRTDPANDLLRAAARLNRWASRHASFDIPFAQARLLALLDELGPARVSTIAEADHSSQPTTTAGLHRLEAQGWVHRSPDPSDARASLVSLTPVGSRARAQVRRARAAVLAPALDLLDPAERARLEEAIDVLETVLARTAHHHADHHPVPREEA
jgi:DNA-binding MarR family transcriptional regulator